MDRPTLTQQGYRGWELLRAIFTLPPEGFELTSGVLNIGWGAILLIGRPFSTGPAFFLMAQLGHLLGDPIGIDPHVVWAIPLLIIGVAVLITMFSGASLWLRIICCGMSVAMWTFILIAIAGANWRTTGTVIYSLIVACQFWALIRLRLARLGQIRRAKDIQS